MEFDVVKKPHPDHPLILYQQGKPEGDREACCSKCGQPWRPPAFGCSECSFVIHQSCLDLPHETHTPFHPHHKLLSLTTNNSNYLCNCCGQMPFGDVYRCPECEFQMDVQCAIADTKASGIIQMKTSGNFRHFSHPHPLTLVQHQKQRGKERGACLVCGWPIDSGSSAYFCCLCNSHIHRQCAEMQREIPKLDYHPHPLFLFASTWTNNDNDDTRCDNCIDDCKNGGFFYSCVMCNFNLHLPCLSSFKHQHTFEHVKKHKNKMIPYDSVCPLCSKRPNYWERDDDWFCCSECNLLAHGKCVELPIFQTSQHHHSLALTYRLDSTYNICRICGREMDTRCGGYVCHECSYVAHLICAKSIQREGQNNSIVAVDPIPSGIGIEPHFSGHEHKLSLCAFEDDSHRQCNGCMQSISTQSYGCPPCGFYLHQECASLPRQHMNSLLHPHRLTLLYVPNFVFSCAWCRQYCHGFAYHCEKCHYTIDIRCGVLKFPFTHPSHPHPLLSFGREEGISGVNIQPSCDCCGQYVGRQLVFRCKSCYPSVFLDFKCAHLPLAVRNRFDQHPLSLTFVINYEYENYCDICEEKREGRKKWFYSCKLCCFDAHINCVLGDYPFLKSAQFQGHHHPLSLVEHGNEGRSPCGQCGESCQGQLAFQCEDVTCNFTVHAFGLCYHNQLTQGRITFIMPSLRYRSIPLYSNIAQNQKKGSNLIIPFDDAKKHEDVGRKVVMSLGQHGDDVWGEEWEDEVFSSIKKVVISHGKYIDSIQTEYYDDNNKTSIWSERHGGNGDEKSEVLLDHPEEYLISIHGSVTYISVETLTLESNKTIYGPFGKRSSSGRTFWFPSGGAKIVGFHGRSDDRICAIGVKVVPIHSHIFI